MEPDCFEDEARRAGKQADRRYEGGRGYADGARQTIDSRLRTPDSRLPTLFPAPHLSSWIPERIALLAQAIRVELERQVRLPGVRFDFLAVGEP